MKKTFPLHISLVIGSMILCILILTQCINNPAKEKVIITHNNGRAFAGSESCRNCHQVIYDSFLTTSHHLASGKPSKEYIKGSFAVNENIFDFDEHQQVRMEERDRGLFQAAYTDGKQTRAERFDIVIGSGKHGQTYLYWKNGELYQLPISYSAGLHTWANSPGLPLNKMFFDRTVEARCMECHATFIKEKFYLEYDPAQVIYGIECERCHGPAAEHVSFHTQHPGEKNGKFVVNTGSLGRQINLDLCALCHSASLEPLSPAFRYQPGDTITKFFRKNDKLIDSSKLDVHANQYGLLTASKCFRVSQTMTCGSCHNTHVKETGNLAAYGLKCMNCHASNNHECGFTPPAGFSMESNCVNCHMPQKDSKNILFLNSGKPILSPEVVRSHLIAIYKSETEKVINRNR